MPRENGYMLPGFVYHVTHRCHDRSFLFKFALDCDEYRRMLLKHLRAFLVSLLNYCIHSQTYVVAAQ